MFIQKRKREKWSSYDSKEKPSACETESWNIKVQLEIKQLKWADMRITWFHSWCLIQQWRRYVRSVVQCWNKIIIQFPYVHISIKSRNENWGASLKLFAYISLFAFREILQITFVDWKAWQSFRHGIQLWIDEKWQLEKYHFINLAS